MSDERHPWVIWLNFLAIECRAPQEDYAATPSDLFYVMGDRKVLKIEGELPIPHLTDWTRICWSHPQGSSFQLKTTQIFIGGGVRKTPRKTRDEMVTQYAGAAYVHPEIKQDTVDWSDWNLDEARDYQDEICLRITDDWSWAGIQKNNIGIELVNDWKGSPHRFTVHQEPFERDFGPKKFLMAREQFEEFND